MTVFLTINGGFLNAKHYYYIKNKTSNTSNIA